MKEIIQSNIFDPLVPYLISIDYNCRKVEFRLPHELVLDMEEIKKYFSEVKITAPRPYELLELGLYRRIIEPKPLRTLSGTLKSKKIGKYLFSKMR